MRAVRRRGSKGWTSQKRARRSARGVKKRAIRKWVRAAERGRVGVSRLRRRR